MNAHSQKTGAGCRNLVIRSILAIALILCGSYFDQTAAQMQPAHGVRVETDVWPKQIKWGQEIKVTVSALNKQPHTYPGGIYITFDQDVLVLEAKGAHVHYPGAKVYSVKHGKPISIKRPLVEAWFPQWLPGQDHRIELLVLPINGKRVRVKVRATFIKTQVPLRLLVYPDAVNSSSYDEMGFPAEAHLVWIKRRGSARRAIRRMAEQVRELDLKRKHYFARTLSGALTQIDQYARAWAPAASGSTDTVRSLKVMAPRISTQLRDDPINALHQLECLMIDLNCYRALVYFGIPLEFYAETSPADSARAKGVGLIKQKQGGDILVALLDAEGITISFDRSSKKLLLASAGREFAFSDSTTLNTSILDKVIASLPAARSATTHNEANGYSFHSLRKILAK